MIIGTNYKGLNKYVSLLFVVLSFLLLIICMPHSALGVDRSEFSFGTGELIKRKVSLKPFHTPVGKDAENDSIIVKFVEMTDIRLRNNDFVSLKGHGLERMRALLAMHKVAQIDRLFNRHEQALSDEKYRGQQMSGRELADLNQYYRLRIDPDKTDTEALVDALNELDIVEIAYPEAIPQLTATALPTPQFYVNDQAYLKSATSYGGIDVDYARTLPYTRGEGIRLIDIEWGWNLSHEDLLLTTDHLINNMNSTAQDYRDHGTAVLGVIAGVENSYGVTGIAPEVDIGLVSLLGSSNGNDIHGALDIAKSNLDAGEIMLIEVGMIGPDTSLACENTICPNCDQFEMVPMEYERHNFDSIETATANGIIVVEGAGNGQMNLDNPVYNQRFDRNFRDSGALLIGAGSSSLAHFPACWSNYGNRLDIQGWGADVTTTGYGFPFDGDYEPGGDVHDENRFYSLYFGGTSSASAIVSGAAAVIQGYRKNNNFGMLGPKMMRQFLKDTGTPQTGDRQIGPLPNLYNALNANFPKLDIKANGTDGTLITQGEAVTLTVSFNINGYVGTGNPNKNAWIAARLSDGTGPWYMLTLDSQGQGIWTDQPLPVYYGGMQDVISYPVFTGIPPAGKSYQVFFAVDLSDVVQGANILLDNYIFEYI